MVEAERPSTVRCHCGMWPFHHQWRPETWWWNDKVEDAVKEKRIRYKAYNALKKVSKVVEAKEAKTAYNEAKRVAKRVVWLAKSEDDISPTGDGVFRLA